MPPAKSETSNDTELKALFRDLKKARLEQKASQADYARDFGITQSYYSKIEGGKIIPNDELLHQLKQFVAPWRALWQSRRKGRAIYRAEFLRLLDEGQDHPELLLMAAQVARRYLKGSIDEED